eukprot:GHVS01046018.1.p1 GENE.GHVS01046018.1~~GHVS01046018.1.p1  ORF type:complete len:176 (-),score=19.19 GHVS01046018.1:81-608(-)
MATSAFPHAVVPMLVPRLFSYQPQDTSSLWSAPVDSTTATAQRSRVPFNRSAELADLLEKDATAMKPSVGDDILITISKLLQDASEMKEEQWSSIQFLIPFERSTTLFGGDGANAKMIARSTQTVLQRQIKTAEASDDMQFVCVRLFGTTARICWAHSLVKALIYDNESVSNVNC